MKIQSAVLTNGSGSIGGMTAAKNRGGLYLRARAAVTNPQTAGQTLIRTMFSNVSTTWKTLTGAQRTAWENWATNSPRVNVFGNPYLMTGLQAYIALNTPRLQAGIDAVVTPPALFGRPTTPVPEGEPTLIIDTPDVNLVIPVKFNNAIAADSLLYVSKPQNASKVFFKGPYTLLGTQPVAASAGSTNIEADETSLPPVSEGQVLFYRITYSDDDGNLSGELSGKVVATVAP